MIIITISIFKNKSCIRELINKIVQSFKKSWLHTLLALGPLFLFLFLNIKY
jgi:hypothetical protein